MSDLVFGIVLGIVGLTVIVLFRAVRKKRVEQNYYELLLSAATREEAEQLYEQSVQTLVSQLIDPIASGISEAEAVKALEIAVFSKDRLNEIDGLDYGPSFRLKVRPEILSSAKIIADRY